MRIRFPWLRAPEVNVFSARSSSDRTQVTSWVSGREPGDLGPRVEWKDVTGRTVETDIRDTTTDPHVTGPYETGCGFADWNQQEAKGIIVSLPDDIQ